MAIQDTRSVATYSIATNRPKNSSEEPRSRSNTRTARLASQAMRIGPRSRARGRVSPSTLRPATERASRVWTR